MGRPKLGYHVKRDRGDRCYLRVDGFTETFTFNSRNPTKAEIADALAKIKGPSADPLAVETDTLRVLVDAYYKWTKFIEKDAQTQRARRNVLEQLLASKTAGGQLRAHGKVYDLTRRHVQAIQDEYAARGVPAQGNKAVDYLRYVFDYAIKVEWPGVSRNPCEGVDRLEPVVKINPNDETPYTGHREWTLAEAMRVLEFYRDNPQAYLTFSLMLLTGLRISDARKVGRSMEKTVNWRGTMVRCLVLGETTKGAKKRAKKGQVQLKAVVPLVADSPFVKALDRWPTISPTYLLNEDGNRWKSAKALDRRVRRWLNAITDEDGTRPYDGMSSHGLRYTAARWWAQTYRTTPHELMAIFAWNKIEQAMRYTQRYDREESAAGVVVRFPGR